MVCFILLTMLLNAGKVGDISGTQKLKNYNEIKNMEIGRIVDYNECEIKNGTVYVRGEETPLTGLMLKYKNKKIIGLYFYKDGKSYGNSYDYYENGIVFLSQFYDNDLRNGTEYTYYPNGKLEKVRNFVMEREEGEQLDYAKNGNLKIKSYYKDGKIIDGIWYKDGLGSNKYGGNYGTFVSTGNEHGIITLYKDKVLIADSVVKITDQSTVELIEDGRTRYYHPNGQVKVTADRIDGSAVGKVTAYYENGVLAVETNARDNKINGETIVYYENGNRRMYCENIVGDYIRGRCETYNENGEMIHEGYFDNVSFDTIRREKTGAINSREDFIKILQKYLF